MATFFTRLLFSPGPAQILDHTFGVTHEQEGRWKDVAALLSLDQVSAAEALKAQMGGRFVDYFRAEDLRDLRMAFVAYADSVYNEDGKDVLWCPAQPVRDLARYSYLAGSVTLLSPVETYYHHSEREDLAFSCVASLGNGQLTRTSSYTGISTQLYVCYNSVATSPNFCYAIGYKNDYAWASINIDPKQDPNTSSQIARAYDLLPSELCLVRPGVTDLGEVLIRKAPRGSLSGVRNNCQIGYPHCGGSADFSTACVNPDRYTAATIEAAMCSDITYQASWLDLRFCSRPAKELQGFLSTTRVRTPRLPADLAECNPILSGILTAVRLPAVHPWEVCQIDRSISRTTASWVNRVEAPLALNADVVDLVSTPVFAGYGWGGIEKVGQIRVEAVVYVSSSVRRAYVPGLRPRPGALTGPRSVTSLGLRYSYFSQAASAKMEYLADGWWQFTGFTADTYLMIILETASLTGDAPVPIGGGTSLHLDSTYACLYSRLVAQISSQYLLNQLPTKAFRLTLQDSTHPSGYRGYPNGGLGPQTCFLDDLSGPYSMPGGYAPGDVRPARLITTATGNVIAASITESSTSIYPAGAFSLPQFTHLNRIPVGLMGAILGPKGKTGLLGAIQHGTLLDDAALVEIPDSKEFDRIISPMWLLRERLNRLVEGGLSKPTVTLSATESLVGEGFTDMDHTALAGLLGGYKQTPSGAALTGAFTFLGSDDRIYWVSGPLAASVGLDAPQVNILSVLPIMPDGSPAQPVSRRTGVMTSLMPLMMWRPESAGAVTLFGAGSSGLWLFHEQEPCTLFVPTYSTAKQTKLISYVEDLANASYAASGTFRTSSSILHRTDLISYGKWNFINGFGSYAGGNNVSMGTHPDNPDTLASVTLTKLQFSTSAPLRIAYGQKAVSNVTISSTPSRSFVYDAGLALEPDSRDDGECPRNYQPDPCGSAVYANTKVDRVRNSSAYLWLGQSSDPRMARTLSFVTERETYAYWQTNDCQRCYEGISLSLSATKQKMNADQFAKVKACPTAADDNVYSENQGGITVNGIMPVSGKLLNFVEIGPVLGKSERDRRVGNLAARTSGSCQASIMTTSPVHFWYQYKGWPTLDLGKTTPWQNSSGAGSIFPPVGDPAQLVTSAPQCMDLHLNERIVPPFQEKVTTDLALGWQPFPVCWAVALPTYRPLFGWDLRPSMYTLDPVFGVVKTLSAPGNTGGYTTHVATVQTSRLFYWVAPGEGFELRHMGGPLESVYNLSSSVGVCSLSDVGAIYIAASEGDDCVIMTDIANQIQAHVHIRVRKGPMDVLRLNATEPSSTLYCLRAGAALSPKESDTLYATSAPRGLLIYQAPDGSGNSGVQYQAWAYVPAAGYRARQELVSFDLQMGAPVGIVGGFTPNIWADENLGVAKLCVWANRGSIRVDTAYSADGSEIPSVYLPTADTTLVKSVYEKEEAIRVSTLIVSNSSTSPTVTALFPIDVQLACWRESQGGLTSVCFVLADSRPEGLTSSTDGKVWTLDRAKLDPVEARLPGKMTFVFLARVPGTSQYLHSATLWSTTNPG